MFPCSLEALVHQPLVLPKRLTVYSTHDFYVFQWELEWCCFESDVSRGIREHEAEVDVDNVPIAVN